VIGFLTSYRRFRMDKARELLGWEPRIGLSEGIERCVPFLRQKGLLGRERRSARAA
jgi:nucleoside-diphosphate-sugar epimerase